MKKNKWIVLCMVFVLLLIGSGIYLYMNRNSNNDEGNYNATKTATEENSQSQEYNNSTQNLANNINTENNVNEIRSGITSTPTTEEQISTFSTKIYSQDSSRQNNIQITCNTLNNTIIKAGETFSFCQTVRSGNNC